jgi:hypothetical protein
MKKNLYIFAALLLLSGCLNREPKPASAAQNIQAGKYQISGVVTLSPEGVVIPTDTVVVVPPVSVGAFSLGINTHPWIKPELLLPIKFHRQYISSYYFWTGLGGRIKPQPMVQAGTPVAWGLDDMLANAQKAGCEVLLTIHQTPTWFLDQGRGDGGGDYAPVLAGKNRLDTNSYREYALAMQQIAMRYGPTKYPDRLLNVDSSARWNGDKNVKKSGLNLLKWLQPWNEPPKWWKIGTPEAQAYFSPEETACLMSMCYDYIHPTGVKVAMPPLTDFDFPYVQAMNVWFVKYRKDKKWPCDVMCYNHYLNLGNNLGQHPAQWITPGGCLPAQDRNFPTIKTLVAFGKERGLPVWVTETGYDENGGSPMQFVGTDLQRGEALAETAKAFAAEGVSAVFLFTAADEPSAANGGLYTSCGILKGQAQGYARKPAFSPVAKLSESLNVKAAQQPQAVINRTKKFAIPTK